MFIKLILVCLSLSHSFLPISSRDICSRYAVLKEIDSFTLSEKETTPVILELEPFKKLVSNLQTHSESFSKQLTDFSKPGKLNPDPVFFPLSEDINFVPVLSPLQNFSDKCIEVAGSVPRIPGMKDLLKMAQAMSSLNLDSIPVSLDLAGKTLVAEDGTPLGVPADDEPNLTSYPLLSFPEDPKTKQKMYKLKVSSSDVDTPIKGLCVKSNSPWSRAGFQKSKWTKLISSVKRNLPEILKFIDRFQDFSSLKINKNFNLTSIANSMTLDIPVPNSLRKIIDLT